jgi:diguanylate cyclase (GGDEF)-like protein
MDILEKLNQIFISDRLLQDSVDHAHQRAVVLVGVVIISAISALAMTISLTILYGFSSEPLHLQAALIAWLTMAGYLGTLWYFQRWQVVLPAANLYALTTTFSTVFPCMITGGISTSPYLMLVLIVPIFMSLIAGRTYGLYWTLVTICCVALLLILESAGIQFPQILPDAWKGYFKFVTWLTTLGLLVLGIIIYENNFEKMNEQITVERSQFAHEALHDPLTGLSNRKLFFTRAQEAVDYALAHEHKAAFIYVDLDDFKSINDELGHDIGDEVLNAVAQRLKANVRSIDTVARLGGDEFAIVLHGLERVDVAETIVKKLQLALREPLMVGQVSLLANGSMGLAVAPDDGQDVDLLLRMADEAMYRAKSKSTGSPENPEPDRVTGVAPGNYRLT